MKRVERQRCYRELARASGFRYVDGADHEAAAGEVQERKRMEGFAGEVDAPEREQLTRQPE